MAPAPPRRHFFLRADRAVTQLERARVAALCEADHRRVGSEVGAVPELWPGRVRLLRVVALGVALGVPCVCVFV